MKRAIGAILFVMYSIIAITVTVLLLSFNDYNCSEIGGYTVYIANDDALEPKYDEGSILLIEETNDKHVKVGDEIFLYKVINSQEYEIVNGILESKLNKGTHMSYQLDNGEAYDSSYFIGKADDTKIIGSPWGTVLSILESKWGYLFCIVIVSLLLFLQEVFDLIIEIKYGGLKGTKAANVAHARKTGTKVTGTAGTSKATATKTAAAKTTTAKVTKTTTEGTVAKVTTAAKTATTVAKTVTKINNTETGEKEG